MARLPCPFVYASGDQCRDYIIRVAAINGAVHWESDDDGNWSLNVHSTEPPYNLICSEKRGHSGVGPQYNEQMRFSSWYELPEALRTIVPKPSI